MKKRRTIFYFLCFFWVFTSFAQENFWTRIDEHRISHLEKMPRSHTLLKYDTYSLNFDALKHQLQETPSRNSGETSGVILRFPDSGGQLKSYIVYEASVMHPDLAEQFSDIQSYVGYGIEDRTAMIRFSITVFGFHGMIFSAKTPISYIDTHTKDLQNYVVYTKSNALTHTGFECNFDALPEETGVFFSPKNAAHGVENNAGIFRTYRLALACTEEYSAFHINAAGVGGGTLQERQAAVLGAMNVTMTRVNGIYERDMSLTMQIIPGNLAIVFLLPENPDSLSNNNTGVLLNQIQSVIDGAIGFANYDMGHVFCTGNGGIAMLGSVCGSNKARGVTGQSQPVGDPFDVDYVSHEMGHQFGANHTQNNNCARNTATAVEPGSGSTIMGYANICPPNVQGASDSYFHAVSKAEMDSFVAVSGNCSTNMNNNNTAPIIEPIPNYIIPVSTPFVLKGNATDPDGDVMTYTWEQTNNQVSVQPPQASSFGGPNFRSLTPSDSPDRYMPNLPTVLAGSTANTWEVVPSVGRTMNFAFTVRDNGNPNGGQTSRQNITVTTSAVGGPFVVTSQNTGGVNWSSGDTETITWNVAGTTSAPINAQFVDILLSTNNGESFDVVLAQNTPNDGTEEIVVPEVSAPFCRVMVIASDNIFYNVNSVPFSIDSECIVYTETPNLAIPDGTGSNSPGPAVTSTITVPEDADIQDIKVSVDISHTYIGDLVITLTHPDGTAVTLWNRNCNNAQFNGINVTFAEDAPNISCASPTTGTYAPANSLSAFDGKPIDGDWVLSVTDFFIQDTGTLNAWSLNFDCVLSRDDVFAEKFTVFPNPNKGSFTIQGVDLEINSLNAAVYDLSGRLIYSRELQVSGMLSENITLPGGVQTGVYLLVLSDRDRSATHRIMVNN